jgi:hypothetical protein
MSKLVKNPEGIKQKLNPLLEELALPLNSFNIQTNRITSRDETYLKIKGAFKIKVQNKGDIGIKIFGNLEIPSYAEETFETGDTNLGFVSNTAINYDQPAANENINILLTSYFKIK